MAETYEMQSSIRHSKWLKHLVDVAKPFVPTPGGMGVTVQQFFAMATGAAATKMLKEAGNYEDVKKRWEQSFGPVSDFDLDIILGKDNSGVEKKAQTEDALYNIDDIKENILDG